MPFGVSAQQTDFSQCLSRLESDARQSGIAETTIEAVMPNVVPRERVIRADRNQAEFVDTFADYLGVRVSERRVATGRELLSAHAELLGRLTREYGVPGRYLVAFWGLESNYGGYLGSMPTLDSLATLACDERRAAFFTEEFLVALELMQREGLTVDHMRGSWAGAMGHTQFMPSAYQQYAVDGDGDGQVDLWGSEADALTSGAHFLSELGWVPYLRWGREVRLPKGFDYALAGDGQWRALEDWAALGIARTNGAALPVAPVDALLLVPAGAEGPAFLVYRNFEVIMRWNRSESYALAVGLLADQNARIAMDRR